MNFATTAPSNPSSVVKTGLLLTTTSAVAGMPAINGCVTSVFICMIETPEALANVEEIAKVPGIDVLHVGCNDYLVNMGLPGKFDGPEIAAALERVRMAGVKDSEIPDSLKLIEGNVKERGPGAHPMTGPIYVEGAEPGDSLEVHILGFEFLHVCFFEFFCNQFTNCFGTKNLTDKFADCFSHFFILLM